MKGHLDICAYTPTTQSASQIKVQNNFMKIMAERHILLAEVDMQEGQMSINPGVGLDRNQYSVAEVVEMLAAATDDKMIQDMAARFTKECRRLKSYLTYLDDPQRYDPGEEELDERSVIQRIGRMREKMAQARTGAYIDLPVFSIEGYSLKARLYLNGNGIGKDGFLSVFVVVMKGTYDDDLQWPFRARIHFTLVDQSDDGSSCRDMFQTDPGSTSFAPPTEGMTIGYGMPCFISLHEFQQRYEHFVKDDTMILKVRVDPD